MIKTELREATAALNWPSGQWNATLTVKVVACSSAELFHFLEHFEAHLNAAKEAAEAMTIQGAAGT